MKLACLGDSLTYGYKLERSRTWPSLIAANAGFTVENKGINGDTTAGMLSRFYRDVVEPKATLMILMGGSNDFILGVPSAVVHANIASMIQQAYYYGVVPVIGVPLPVDIGLAKKYWPFVKTFDHVSMELREYRNWIFDFAGNFKCGVIDFYSDFYDFGRDLPQAGYLFDGLHPNREGHKLIAERAASFLNAFNFNKT